MAHKWTPDDEATLRDLIGSGYTYEAAAERLRELDIVPDASFDSVRAVARRIGATRGGIQPQAVAVNRDGERMDPGVKGGDRYEKLIVPVRPNDRVAILSDTQIPFHDQKSIDAVERFLDDFQPNVLVWNGDIADFYGLSKYEKNPKNRPSVQQELDITHRMQARQANRHPTAKRIWILGNHEDRLRRFLWENPQIASLRAFDNESIFTRDGMFQILSYGSHVQINNTRIEHGGPVRSKSGYSARALFEKRGTSVVMGHTHRLSQSSHRNALGQHTMIEGGCLCDLSPEYGEEPDWTQGFVYGFVNNGSTHWYTVPILVDGFRAEGRFYKRDH